MAGDGRTVISGEGRGSSGGEILLESQSLLERGFEGGVGGLEVLMRFLRGFLGILEFKEGFSGGGVVMWVGLVTVVLRVVGVSGRRILADLGGCGSDSGERLRDEENLRGFFVRKDGEKG